MNQKQNQAMKMILFFLIMSLFFSGCQISITTDPGKEDKSSKALPSDLAEVTEAYKILNGNQPKFSAKEKKSKKAFETYSNLDRWGRCGTAYANVCKKLMPVEKRSSIGTVKPSGWQTVKYDIVDGKYLYNRCHLIGFQLAGENANEKNLITGTRFLNVEGMLPFENQVADYVKKTGNHVLYRATPVFEGNNLLASGVELEAYSVEDQGKGICFYVFAYNIQPGIEIDYATGESRLRENAEDIAEEWNQSYKRIEKQKAAKEKAEAAKQSPKPEGTAKAKENQANRSKTKKVYVINTSTKKFHDPGCSSAKEISPENRKQYRGEREKLLKRGYEPCGKCKP